MVVDMFPSNIHVCSSSSSSSFFICIALLQLCVTSTSSDVQCLRTLKESIEDPLNILGYTWKFDGEFDGFICQFTGVECWHQNENRVLNIRLIDLGLRGQFPRGLEKCTTMTGLDLSSNHLSGPIPADINKSLGFLTTLDLSSNQFSGEIPATLGDCKFLNTLKLDNNRLTGQIPEKLTKLDRLKTFSVSNNLLSGLVPMLGPYVVNKNYANNPGLCGGSLGRCRGASGKPHADGALIAGMAVGFLTSWLVALLLCYFYRDAFWRCT